MNPMHGIDFRHWSHAFYATNGAIETNVKQHFQAQGWPKLLKAAAPERKFHRMLKKPLHLYHVPVHHLRESILSDRPDRV
jgi:hypothetical protein